MPGTRARPGPGADDEHHHQGDHDQGDQPEARFAGENAHAGRRLKIPRCHCSSSPSTRWTSPSSSITPSTSSRRRPRLRNVSRWSGSWSEREQLRAEHGYALWVTVTRAGERSTVLYDAGLGRETAAHNLDVLGYDLQDVRALVFSHGHADHHAGLEGITRRIGRRGCRCVVAPRRVARAACRLPERHGDPHAAARATRTSIARAGRWSRSAARRCCSTARCW